jgi:hypothetical protein
MNTSDESGLTSQDGMALNQEAVLKAVKGLTNLDFRPGKVERYPVPKQQVKEFFWPADPRASRKKPHVHVMWIDIDNTVHIETDRLGNTIDMIEWIYGSEWMINLRRVNLEGFEKKGEAWTEFKKEFPPVVNRLLKYETVVSEISEKHKVPLEMLYHGSQGLASFRMEARIDSAELASLSVERAIHTAIAALEEAFYKIRAHQKRLADAWGYLPAR